MNILRRAYRYSCRSWRIVHYRILSSNGFVGVAPIRIQPVLFNGGGEILFEGTCRFGVPDSPGFHNTYAYIEARGRGSRVVFGEGSWFSNNFQALAGGGEIRLGRNLRVGINFMVVNSDFHRVDPQNRDTPPFPSGNVLIGDNVFIGNNVTVLKGVTIGDHSTIGSGSVVTGDIPTGCVAAGIPAKVIKQLKI